MALLPAGFPGLAGVPLIVVATAPAAAATESFSTASAAARRIGLWFCFVDLQGPAGQLSSIQGRNPLLGPGRFRHFDKREPARPSGFALGDPPDLVARAIPLPQPSHLSCP